jgi:hypothetical protein
VNVAKPPVGGYLIYHPPRWKSRLGNVVVYHDHIGGHNQDPYLWNLRFLHTYCHMTQMDPRPGYVNLWVAGDTFPKFNALFCDLVFVVEGQRHYWASSNHIEPTDELVDSLEAYVDHYQWAGKEHPLKRRRRYTLKADPELSFQSQTRPGQLIDILPWLEAYGYSRDRLRRSLQAAQGSRPMALKPEIVEGMAAKLGDTAYQQLRGAELMPLRQHPEWGQAQLKP